MNRNLLKMLAVLIACGGFFASCDDDDDGPTFAELLAAAQASFASYADSVGNVVVDPSFAPQSIIPTSSNLPTAVTVTSPAGFISNAPGYIGAVDPTSTTANAWYAGWSFYARLVAGNTTDINRNPPTIVDTLPNLINFNKTLSKDTIWIINGRTIVDSTYTLSIDAGTFLKGMGGDGEDASVLIIRRGAKIMATGTPAEPIIFTATADPLDGTADATARGLWGGIIILGSSELNTVPSTQQIEGIPTTEPAGNYGGSNLTDNSGTMRYVSIRHGGKEIGEGNEINGLTLGGVGSGTTLEFIEVIGNKDDGIEWFGGTCNGRNLIAAFMGDDGIDYDQGYRGENQFVIVHQDPTTGVGDRGGEHDGGTDPEDGMPFATPYFVNTTFVGNGENRAITFRDNAGGFYYNSIFQTWDKGIDIEFLDGVEQDSKKQFDDGNLKIENCAFFNVANDSISGIFQVTGN